MNPSKQRNLNVSPCARAVAIALMAVAGPVLAQATDTPPPATVQNATRQRASPPANPTAAARCRGGAAG